MITTNKQEAEVLEMYEIWLHSYLNGDVKTYDSYLSDDYRFIGSTDNEDFLNRTDTTKFFEATVDQLAGKVEIRNNRRTIEKFDELYFITDLFDAYFLNDKDWSYYGKFRFTSALKKNKEGWRFIYQHFSTPDSKAKEGETLGTQQIAEENLQLREAVQRRTIELEQKSRELEVEAALERIRARSMAMHKSSELNEVAHILFEQLRNLGGNLWGTGFGLCQENSDSDEFYFANEKGVLPSVTIPHTIDPAHSSIYEGWKNKSELFSISKEGKELKEHYDYMLSLPQVRPFFQAILDAGLSFPEWQQWNAAYFTHGLLLIITLEPFPEPQILVRFAKVFEQAYIRFLDLKKAEAQAREAEIELALERVRARTMAMQHSEELAEASFLLDSQVRALGIKTRGCAFNIYGDNESTEWFSSALGTMPTYKTPRENVFLRYYKEGLKGKSMFIKSFEGDACAAHYDYLCTLPVMGEALKEFKKSGGSFPTQQIDHVTYFKYGYLLFITLEPVPDAHDIFLRFAKVFEQTYTRFLDLQKAEAQAREAQIEAALERVRSRSMEMQKSEELSEVIALINAEITKLGIITDNTGIITDINFEKDKLHSVCMWFSIPGKTYSNKFLLPYTDHATYLKMDYAFNNKKEIYSEIFSKEEKNSYFNIAFKESDLKFLPDERKEVLLNAPAWSRTVIFHNNSGLMLHRFDNIPFTEEENAVALRFGKVFEQTYTRFLDLQKAEKQVREAQIEAALERIRARSMAMHKSDELVEVVTFVFQQLKLLNIRADATYINTDLDNKKVLSLWVANESYARLIHIPYFQHTVNDSTMKAYENRTSFIANSFTTEEKNSYFEHAFKYSDLRDIPQNRKKYVLDGTSYYQSIAINRHSSIATNNYYGYELSQEENEVLIRFSKVFEQAYIRFLDLKKAEKLAREAQIEAALERVRAASMAMHKSDELQEVISVVLNQMISLGIKTDVSYIVINAENTKDFNLWLATENNDYARQINLPYFKHPIHDDGLKAAKKQVGLDTHSYSREEKNRYFEYQFKHSDLKYSPEERKKFILDAPGYTRTIAINKHTSIAVDKYATTKFSTEENEILIRIAKVFEQAYTRFLDIKKAEAQAREAQIEAALERVRSRSLAMNHSNELQEVISVVFVQMQDLGIKADASLINILTEDSRDFYLWIGTVGQTYAQKIRIPYIKHPVFDVFYKARERGETFMTDNLTRAEKDSFFEYAFKYSDLKLMPADRQKYVMDSAGFARSFAWSKNSGITVQNYAGIPYTDQENETLKRFAQVFEQAYTRFLDVKNAEAQAQEAIKQASLDRVRGEIASMRNKDDLNRITPLIWKELTTLGVPFIRCGMFIMDEQNQHIHTFLSTPNGESIAAFYLPYSTPGNFTEMVNHWRQNKIYIHHWGEVEFRKLADILLQNGTITSREQYMSNMPKEGIHLNFLPFLQGMLYVGNTEPLSNDQLQLVQNLSNAFSTAYARYEDFAKLETAKNQIENTLSELKSAQSQLIQAEKMASLGELTAGIAHEIQNPLNFVNNFSEVSNELIVEIEEERSKNPESRDENLVSEILSDIKQNLEKINHHGKRASEIVKSMLLHSRTSSGQKELTDINALADEYLRLAYHGLRAKDKSFNADFKTEFDENLPKINVIPQDIGRVLLNLINNAFYAVQAPHKAPPPPKGGIKNDLVEYRPTVIVRTSYLPSSGASPDKSGGTRGAICISVSDNGPGIPDSIKDKIFQPFFTTKPTGSGTGLGLSLSYDIVKAHGGEIKVNSNEGEARPDDPVGRGTEFIIQLNNL